MVHSPDLRSASRLLPGLVLALSATAEARDWHYGALENEDLLACEAQYWRGERTEAAACYRALAATPSQPPELRAEAMWALGDVKTANSLFQTAVQSSPDSARVRLRWGELFIQTYQYQDALDLFTEALSLDPENPYAHLGAAEALREGGSGEGVTEHMAAVMDSFATPPGARLRGQLLAIHTALEQDRHAEARDALAEAWELAREEDLLTLELHALEAALAFLTLEDPQPHIDAALAENPAYGDAYAIPGYYASITRRYKESGEFYQQAVEVQPDHWQAHLELGQNYLRLNYVSEAIRHVELAYENDPFNPKAVNTLRLLDTFVEDFVLVNYPDPPAAGGIPELTLRLHRDERDILRHYARELAEESIATFAERYRFTPREPVIVEIYPNHEDFVVRSIGMPGVGILGVTFGYLFAMDSPSGHPDETYHWGTTLWHEMAHVFTLEATNHFVPRWFSEGISVFEEWRTGPIPGIRIPHYVLEAMAEGKFLPIAELDDGFMRPSYENQVMVSYMQAGLVFEFIDREYGFDKIVDILYRFDGKTRPEQAIESVLGISVAEFDRHFKEFIDIQYGQLLGNLRQWTRDFRAAFDALNAEDWEGAIAAAEKANFLYPDYVENDSPYLAMARAWARLEEEEKEFETLQEFWRRGGYAPRALMALAERYIERGMQEEAVEVFTDITYVDPFNEEMHAKYGDLLLAMDRPREALREYQINLAMKPIDLAGANYRLAQAYQALEDEERTMAHLMTALDIAPQYRPAQMLLLELSRQDAGADASETETETETTTQ